MAKRIRQVSTNIEDRAPSSTSKGAVEEKGNKTLTDKPEKEGKIPGESMLLLHLFAGAPSYVVNGKDAQASFQAASVNLYSELEPRDPPAAMLAALAVAVTNTSMDCLNRAVRCYDSLHARDLNLRHGLKGASIVRDLISALDSRHGRTPSGVNVGEVNVESGGQAIVGNVERHEAGTGKVRRVRPKAKR